ncbi:hypothetical protein ACFQ36_19295, partial [Arthrobacter sp. GCM10027362]
MVPARFFPNGPPVIHLARGNPVRQAIEANPNVAFGVVGGYAFIPAAGRPRGSLTGAPPSGLGPAGEQDGGHPA